MPTLPCANPFCLIPFDVRFDLPHSDIANGTYQQSQPNRKNHNPKNYEHLLTSTLSHPLIVSKKIKVAPAVTSPTEAANAVSRRRCHCEPKSENPRIVTTRSPSKRARILYRSCRIASLWFVSRMALHSRFYMLASSI
jgi:hypothetical protein